MTLDDIQARVDALSKAMLAKGLIAPKADFSVNSDAPSQVCISHRKPDGLYDRDRDYQWFASLDEAAAAVAAMPDKAERNRSEFLRLVAIAADFGKQVGMDDVLVNPLVEHMQRISKNALTGPGEREAA